MVDDTPKTRSSEFILSARLATHCDFTCRAEFRKTDRFQGNLFSFPRPAQIRKEQKGTPHHVISHKCGHNDK